MQRFHDPNVPASNLAADKSILAHLVRAEVSTSRKGFRLERRKKQTCVRLLCMPCRMRRGIAIVTVCGLLLLCFATLSSAHKKKSSQVLRLIAQWACSSYKNYCNCVLSLLLTTSHELLSCFQGQQAAIENDAFVCKYLYHNQRVYYQQQC